MKTHKHADFSVLTPAETQAVKLVVGGLSDIEAGKRLKLSPKTINKHRMNAMRKLGVHSAVALTLAAVCAGFIDPCKP